LGRKGKKESLRETESRGTKEGDPKKVERASKQIFLGAQRLSKEKPQANPKRKPEGQAATRPREKGVNNLNPWVLVLKLL